MRPAAIRQLKLDGCRAGVARDVDHKRRRMTGGSSNSSISVSESATK